MSRPAAGEPVPQPARLLPLLTALVAVGIIASTIYMPSLPDMAREFAVSVARVQTTLTVYLLGLGTGQLFFGPLSDRFGRRIVLLGGLALCAAASLACAVAPTVELLALTRIAQALGACAGMVVTRAIIRDVYERHDAARAASLLGVAIAVAPAIAPILGGYIHETLGWRASFVFVTLLAAAMLVPVRRLPETNRHPQLQHSLMRGITVSFAELLRSRGFLAFSGVIAGIFGALYSFVAGAPVVIIDGLGLAPSSYGLVAALPTGGYLAGSLISSRITVKLGIEPMVDLGLGVIVASSLVLLALVGAGHVSVAGLIGPMILWMVGFGIALPNAIAGALSINPRIAGAAAALSGFLQMMGGASGSSALAALPKGDPLALVGTVAAFSLVVTALWLALRRHAGPGAALH